MADDVIPAHTRNETRHSTSSGAQDAGGFSRIRALEQGIAASHVRGDQSRRAEANRRRAAGYRGRDLLRTRRASLATHRARQGPTAAWYSDILPLVLATAQSRVEKNPKLSAWFTCVDNW